MVNDINQVKVHLDIIPFPCQTIYEELQIATYLIAQEHLTNILKHAAASEVTIKLQCRDQYLSLFIRDNGVGFAPSKGGNGIGITNMKTKAALHSGKLSINSQEGAGCTLSLVIPVACCNGLCRPR